MTLEPDTWDQKLGRAIRRVFETLMLGPFYGSSREENSIEAWERAKNEAWERQKEAAHTRSSEELHEELRRLDSSS
jgi:hypothetical protein